MTEPSTASGAISGNVPVSGWRAAFPPAQWLREYRAQWLPKDAIAGVTLAAYGIPVSLAYASLAGLPPQYGIYCYLVGGLLYALFGSSRQLAIGPTSAISMLVGVTVAGMAEGDPARWASIAALSAMVMAVMCVLAWLLRLSSLVSFISETILLGFKAGAALTIAMTQLPKLFGVKGGGEHFFERVVILGGQLPDTNLAVFAFGLTALAVLLLGEKFLPGRPVALFVVVIAIVVLSITPLIDLGFKVVGVLPQGLPDFRLPELRVRDVDGVIPLAFACLLLAYVESVSAARALAEQNGYEINPRQELLGLGAANLAAGFFQAYPVAGGLSQSSVNDKAGAQTPLALVFASITIGLCLVFLTDLLSNLPNVVLAAIVLVAVKGLINIGELRHAWRVSKFEFSVSMVAFAGVLLLGILKGVMLAVVVSMLLLIRRAAHPHVAFLGRIPGTRSFSDFERSPDNEAVRGVLVFRAEASLLYFNVEHVRDAVWQKIRSAPAPFYLVVCDLSASPVVDLAGARMLGTLHAALKAQEIRLRLVAAHASVRDILRAEGLEERIGSFDRRISAADVIEEFQRGSLETQEEKKPQGVGPQPDGLFQRRQQHPESAAREFPPMRVTLRDGRSVTIRAIRPDDADAMRSALDGLSAEARYSRFMGAINVTPALVERFVRPMADRERALMAVAGEGSEESIVGGARYVRGGDSETCEFAITISDGWCGAGLASRMMRVLIADAAARGLKRMEGYVLAANKPMLDLARRLHFEIGPSDEGPSVRLVRLDLVYAHGER